MKFCNLGNEHTLAGISPESSLCATFNCSNLFIPSIDSGNVPTNLLPLTSNTVTLPNFPISCGKQPFNPLFEIIISLSVSFIFPKLDGRHPFRLLFAKTTTDTGEFPRFSGNENWNLLSFMKTASSLRSKRREGTLPSNELNLMSKNFNERRHKRTSGNGPDNWLLLTSSS